MKIQIFKDGTWGGRKPVQLYAVKKGGRVVPELTTGEAGYIFSLFFFNVENCVGRLYKEWKPKETTPHIECFKAIPRSGLWTVISGALFADHVDHGEAFETVLNLLITGDGPYLQTYEQWAEQNNSPIILDRLTGGVK